MKNTNLGESQSFSIKDQTTSPQNLPGKHAIYFKYQDDTLYAWNMYKHQSKFSETSKHPILNLESCKTLKYSEMHSVGMKIQDFTSHILRFERVFSKQTFLT